MLLNQDEYSTVFNGEITYNGIATILKATGHIVFAWTDEEGSQLDILLCYGPAQFGYLQRGMNTATDLFVAVSNCGMFGFEFNDTIKDAGYVGSKLGLGGSNATTIKLAELMNNVMELLK